MLRPDRPEARRPDLRRRRSGRSSTAQHKPGQTGNAGVGRPVWAVAGQGPEGNQAVRSEQRVGNAANPIADERSAGHAGQAFRVPGGPGRSGTMI